MTLITLVALLLTSFSQLPVLIEQAVTNIGAITLAREALPFGPSWVTTCGVDKQGSELGRLDTLATRMEGASAQAMLGRLQWLQGDCSEALRTLEGAVTSRSKNEILWWIMGMAYLEAGQRNNALASFKKASAVPALERLGEQAWRHDDFESALRWYWLAAELNPTLESMLRVTRLQDATERGEIIALWETLVRTLPEHDPEHWFAKGMIAVLQDQSAVAFDAYRRGAELSEDLYSFYVTYANYSRQLGDFPGATWMGQQAISLHPERARAYMLLGDVERGQRHFELAKDWYQRAAQAEPHNELPHQYMGTMALQRGFVVEAKAHFLAARKADPTAPAPVAYLAQIAYKEGNLSQAVALMEQSIAMREQPRPDSYQILGDWHAESGDLKAAIAAYEQALSLGAVGDEDLLSRLASLRAELGNSGRK